MERVGIIPLAAPRGSGSPTLSVVVPTYNEAGNIGPLLAAIGEHLGRAGIAYEILVVDDDSPDGTWRRAGEAARGDPRVRVIRRMGERGLASAAVRGWSEAVGQVLALIDADFQHPPEILVDLARAVEAGASLAVASRFVPESAAERRPLLRRATSDLGVRLIAWLLPGAGRVRDPLSGCFAMRRDLVAGVPLAPRGYKILLEILARTGGGQVREVPFTFQHRREGRSKLTGRIYWEALRQLCHLRRAARRPPP